VNTDILALMKDIQDRVREVAYLMWESAGRQHGMAMEYWLAAERDVVSTMQAATERMMPVQGAGGPSAEGGVQAEGGEDQPATTAEPAREASASPSPAAPETAPAAEPPAEPAAATATKSRRAANGKPAERKTGGRSRSRTTSGS
jgi:hypothetical protein